MNGGGIVKTPTANVDDTSIINAAWAWNLIQSYGLGAGIDTAPALVEDDLNDVSKTGFYTISGAKANTPTGSGMTAMLFHMHRRFSAGAVAFQLLPYSNRMYFRIKNEDVWGEWNTTATQQWTQSQIDALTTLTDDGLKVVSNPNYNNLTDPGFYHCNSTGQQNGPGSVNKLLVLTVKGDTPKYITQVAFPNSYGLTNCPAIRYMDSSGAWSAWQKIALVESESVLKASALWLNASAMIKYPGASSSSIPNFGFEVEDYVKGDDLSKAINARYLVYGKDQSGVAMGALGGMIVGVEQTKKTWARLYAYKNQNGVATADYIGILANPDGTYETRSPHPVTESNDNSIATTAWVTQKVNSNKLTIGNPVSQGASTSGSCTKNTIVYINSSGSLSDVKINGTTVATTSGYHAEQAQQVTLFVPAGGTWSVGHTGNGSVTSVLYQEIN